MNGESWGCVIFWLTLWSFVLGLVSLRCPLDWAVRKAGGIECGVCGEHRCTMILVIISQRGDARSNAGWGISMHRAGSPVVNLSVG